jgi:hypothetical protein
LQLKKQTREEKFKKPLLSERQKKTRKGHKRFNYCRSKKFKKKKAEYEERKMISDREDKKMARFLPSKKKKKENKCRSCKNQLTLQQEQLDARAKILKIKKVNDRKKALEER